MECVFGARNILPDEIACIRYGPCTEILVHLRNLQNTDPFKGTQEEKSVWKILQDDQLTLMISIKIQIL